MLTHGSLPQLKQDYYKDIRLTMVMKSLCQMYKHIGNLEIAFLFLLYHPLLWR